MTILVVFSKFLSGLFLDGQDVCVLVFYLFYIFAFTFAFSVVVIELLGLLYKQILHRVIELVLLLSPFLTCNNLRLYLFSGYHHAEVLIDAVYLVTVKFGGPWRLIGK